MWFKELPQCNKINESLAFAAHMQRFDFCYLISEKNVLFRDRCGLYNFHDLDLKN